MYQGFKGVGPNGLGGAKKESDCGCGGDCGCGSPVKRKKPYKAGMSAAERKTYNNKTGGNLKAPQPEGGPRKKSYCARSAGIKKCKDPDKNGDCPNDIARRNWKC
jgi:hypothetical protein